MRIESFQDLLEEFDRFDLYLYESRKHRFESMNIWNYRKDFSIECRLNTMRFAHAQIDQNQVDEWNRRRMTISESLEKFIYFCRQFFRDLVLIKPVREWIPRVWTIWIRTKRPWSLKNSNVFFPSRSMISNRKLTKEDQLMNHC